MAAWTLTAAGVAALISSDPVLHMTLTPQKGPGGYEALAITLAFLGEADGTTTLDLPDEWGGEEDLWRGVADLRVEGGVLADGDGPARRIVTHAPNAPLVVHYRVRQFHEGEPSASGGDNDYRPFIQPGYFQVLGNTAIIHPSSVDQDAPVTATLPSSSTGETFASDIEHAARGRALTFNDLVESVIVGGDFRVLEGAGGTRLAIRGTWERSDDAWRSGFDTLSAALRRYWRSGDEPYLVTILPLAGSGGVSVGGTGRSDAFAFYATTNGPPETLDGIMAHEMTHTWSPRRIGRMPEGGRDKEAYWLSEGFTDWASWRAMVQGGLWTEAEMAAKFNEHLREYDLSPMRTLPNAEAARRFWSEPEAQRLPYLRGMLLAARWDAAVRRATEGARDFDDVLLTMQSRAAENPALGVVDNLIGSMRAVAEADVGSDLAAMVDGGEAVALPEDAFSACGTIETVNRAPFHRGFDLGATQAAGGVVTGVIGDGPAWRAGLRDGMKLVRRSGGVMGDSTQLITYEVEDAGQARSLSWLPEGAGVETYRRLNLSMPGLACRAQLGGSPTTSS